MSAVRRRVATLLGEPRSEEGFTIIELMMALLVITIAITALLYATYGGMRALTAARERSVFLEAANAEVENLRALPYDSLVASTADANAATAYPGGKCQCPDGTTNRDGVLVDTTAHPTTQPPPAVQSTVTQSSIQGIVLPYTVQRWVSWTDANGGTTHVYKRVDLTVTWTEKAGIQRHLNLNSVVYPGGFGPSGSTNWYPPTPGTITGTPSTGITAGVTSVTLTDTGSADSVQNNPADTSLGYTWNFGDGTPAVNGTATVSHTFPSPGSFTVQLTVSNSHDAVGVATYAVSVAGSATANPTAGFTVDQATGTAPFTANFDGSGSTDPSGGSLTYSWNWGDGSAAGNGANVSHTFSSVGSFSVALTVTNPSGKTGTTSKTVTTTTISCNITSGSFSNPSTNPTANDIKVVSGTPVNTSITFTATTNDACGSILAGLPYSDGSFLIAPMSVVSDVSGVKTWKTTTSSTKKFSTGLHQTGWVYDSVAGTSYSYQFSVHT